MTKEWVLEYFTQFGIPMWVKEPPTLMTVEEGVKEMLISYRVVQEVWKRDMRFAYRLRNVETDDILPGELVLPWTMIG